MGLRRAASDFLASASAARGRVVVRTARLAARTTRSVECVIDSTDCSVTRHAEWRCAVGTTNAASTENHAPATGTIDVIADVDRILAGPASIPD